MRSYFSRSLDSIAARFSSVIFWHVPSFRHFENWCENRNWPNHALHRMTPGASSLQSGVVGGVIGELSRSAAPGGGLFLRNQCTPPAVPSQARSSDAFAPIVSPWRRTEGTVRPVRQNQALEPMTPGRSRWMGCSWWASWLSFHVRSLSGG